MWLVTPRKPGSDWIIWSAWSKTTADPWPIHASRLTIRWLIGPPKALSTPMMNSKRSEERRVGKECRNRWWPNDEKKKEDIRRKQKEEEKQKKETKRQRVKGEGNDSI